MARLAIRMPKMSMTMTEGEVSSWSAEVGDTIAEGDVVCEVMTDKVDMEVESPVAGTLVEITVETGTVEVGEPIGWVEGEDTGGGFGDLLAEPAAEPIAEPSPQAAAKPVAQPVAEPVDAPTDEPASGAEPEPPAAEAPATVLPAEDTDPDTDPDVRPVPDPVPDPAPDPAPENVASRPTGPVPAVPRARGMAVERGIDLASLTGSGPDGLITVADVEAASPSAPPQPSPAPAPASSPEPAVAARPVSPTRRTAVRRVVARTMTPSALVPQFTVWREIRLDAADAERQGVSWTTVLLRAYAAALREVPELLSRWEDDAPTQPDVPVLALAVATDRGLLVPTFDEPDLGEAAAVDAQVREVVRSAQAGRVDPAHMGAANGSLSNLGGLGVDRFQALLTPPQASVLSLGSIRPRPVAVPGGLGVALSLEAGLTVDHRVADGAHGADLLRRFAERLEDGRTPA